MKGCLVDLIIGFFVILVAIALFIAAPIPMIIISVFLVILFLKSK